jgi:hypothetical protein
MNGGEQPDWFRIASEASAPKRALERRSSSHGVPAHPREHRASWVPLPYAVLPVELTRDPELPAHEECSERRDQGCPHVSLFRRDARAV